MLLKLAPIIPHKVIANTRASEIYVVGDIRTFFMYVQKSFILPALLYHCACLGVVIIEIIFEEFPASVLFLCKSPCRDKSACIAVIVIVADIEKFRTRNNCWDRFINQADGAFHLRLNAEPCKCQ